MQTNPNIPDAPPSYEYATSTGGQPSFSGYQASNPGGPPPNLPAYPGTQPSNLPAYPGTQPSNLPGYPGSHPANLPAYPGEPSYPSSYQAYAPHTGLPGPLGQSGHPGLAKASVPANLREDPVALVCPHCHTSVTTRTSTTTQDSAIGWAICLFCFCWPLMWLPCIICRKTTHSCPNCNYQVGTYKSG